MRIHIYSNLIRLILNILFIIFMGVLICCSIINLLKDFAMFPFCVAVIVLTIFIRWILGLGIGILDRYGKMAVLFNDGFIVYKNTIYQLQEFSLKYFKFQWSFLQTDLVIPKLVIVIPHAQNIICYISIKQLKKLREKMKFDIVEI